MSIISEALRRAEKERGGDQPGTPVGRSAGFSRRSNWPAALCIVLIVGSVFGTRYLLTPKSESSTMAGASSPASRASDASFDHLSARSGIAQTSVESRSIAGLSAAQFSAATNPKFSAVNNTDSAGTEDIYSLSGLRRSFSGTIEWDGEMAALINQNFYTVGSKYGDWEILKIESKGMSVRKSGKEPVYISIN